MSVVKAISSLEMIEKFKLNLRGKNERNYLIFRLGINIGVDLSELLSLRIENFENEGRVISLTEQNGKPRKLELSESLRTEIQQYLGDRKSGLLFRARSGGVLTRNQIYLIFQEAAKEIGFTEKLGTIILKKTFAYWSYENGNPLSGISKHLGHSSVKQTKKFLDLDGEPEKIEIQMLDI